MTQTRLSAAMQRFAGLRGRPLAGMTNAGIRNVFRPADTPLAALLPRPLPAVDSPPRAHAVGAPSASAFGGGFASSRARCWGSFRVRFRRRSRLLARTLLGLLPRPLSRGHPPLGRKRPNAAGGGSAASGVRRAAKAECSARAFPRGLPQVGRSRGMKGI